MERIIQITAGKGPTECAWVVAKILKLFLMEARAQELNLDVLHKENGIENGTVQSVSIRLTGKNLASFLSNWLGTVQWVGQSVYRKQHQRKNWFIGVFELKTCEASEFLESDIKFQAIRSSGPGGQHANKVSSAIRAIHLPTGIGVLASDSRSQHQNKKLAIIRLKKKIAATQLNQQKEQLNKTWENHHDLKRGNPIRVFNGVDFKRKKETKSYKSVRKKLKNNLTKEQWD